MKIGVIGAAGKAGREIVKEALRRGHDVTAIVRNAFKLEDGRTAVLEKDIFDLKAEEVKGFDAVVNAFGAAPGSEGLHVEAGLSLIQAFKGAPDTRLIVVGGAGSLYVDEAETTRLVDMPDFPEPYKATALSQGRNLEDLRNASGIRRTFVSPAAFFDPKGPRTGAYGEGRDRLLVNSKGQSYISYADYAIAIVDEIEQARHVGERFSVVGEAE